MRTDFIITWGDLDDLIITGGLNVFPAEVEAVAQSIRG